MVDQEAEKEAETEGWDDTFPRSTPSDRLPPDVLILSFPRKHQQLHVQNRSLQERLQIQATTNARFILFSLIMSVIYPQQFWRKS